MPDTFLDALCSLSVYMTVIFDGVCILQEVALQRAEMRMVGCVTLS